MTNLKLVKDGKKICSICQSEFTEWGNNAQPVNDGRCCNDCNATVVIPARLRMFYDKADNTRG